MFARTMRCGPDVFMVAKQEELISELKWARSRRLSRSKALAKLHVVAADVAAGSLAFDSALAEWEANNLAEYRRLYGTGLCYNLHQSAVAGRGMASTYNVLQTIIANNGVCWFDPLQRWMTPMELLVAQGFPVLPELTRPLAMRGRPCCSFAAAPAAARNRSEVIRQAGNSMNVHVCGVHWLWVLMAVTRLDQL
eukprot:9496107-Pyramimonas_sp.AAC.1